MPNPKQVMSAMQAITKAAESAGQKAPVTANKSLTTTQDFHTSMGDSMRQRAARDKELMDSFNYKYDKGQRVFTEDSAQRNFPPMTVLSRTLEGNRMMRENPDDILSKRIIDELTGKPKRTPHEAGYRVRLEHSPENWSEFSIPESAIKGAVSEAKGGAIRMQVGGALKAIQAVAKATESVNQKVPSARQLMKSGQAVSSEMDAVNRFGNGERLFAFHEMSETPFPIRSVDELKNFTYDQLLSLPTAKASGGAIRMQIGGLGLQDRQTSRGVAPYGMRHGTITPKGKGYFGELKRPDGYGSTELSSEFEYNNQKVEYPLIVPTLSKPELDILLKGEAPTDDILNKAESWAKFRIDQGMSPFASSSGNEKVPMPNPSDELARGGAIRMQVGGLSALANLGKAGTLTNKLSKGQDAARRAELLMHSGDNTLPLVLPRARLSSDFIDQQADRVARQMLGEHVTTGKDTTNLAGRSVKESQRVKGLNYKTTPTGTVAQETPYTPRKGDVKVAFPGDQTVSNKVLNEVEGFPIDSVQEGGAYYGLGQRHLTDPEFWKSTETPAKNVQGKVDRVAELYEPDRVIGTHLAMGPMSNNFAMHLADANLRAIDWSKAQPKNINVFDSIIAYGYKDPKTGEKVKFPNWPGLADREGALAAMKEDSNLRKWVNNRFKTPSLTEPLGLPNGLDIQYAITEPRIRDMEINMTGLMTGKLKPGAKVEAAGNPHNTYTHRILGEAEGPQEVLTPFVIDFPDAAQHIASTKRPSDFTGTIQKVFPHQVVDDQYLNEYNQYRERIKKLTGQKDGGSIEAKPFHDFDQIMKRKDGGTVSTFEQRLKSAIDQHMAGGGEVHMEQGGSSPPKKDLPDMSPQKYLELLALQPKLGVQSEKQIKAFLEEQYRKEKEEGFADKQSRIDRMFKTVTPAIGAGADIGNFLANIPSYATQGLSAVGNYAMSKSPSMSKPASVLDTEGTGDRVPKYPLQSLPEVEPFYGQEAMQRDAKNAGLMGESESPVYDMAMQFLAPYGAYKAPKAIKGGLNATRSGLENTTAAVRNPFQSAMLTMEGVAPDAGQVGGDKFKELLTRRLITNEGAPVNMNTMGGRKTDKTLGQGLYQNKAGVFETNPMVGVNIPRAGNLSTNKQLLADIGTAGQELGQEMVAAHKFTPLLFGNAKDATAMMVRGADGLPLNQKQIIDLAKELPDMIATHSPKAGGMFIAPYRGDALNYAKVQEAASKILGKNAQIKFGKADQDKDIMYRGDYKDMGARAPSAESIAMRDRLKKAEARIVRAPSKSPPVLPTQPPTLTSTLRSAP